MSGTDVLVILVVALASVGLYLALPRRVEGPARLLGYILSGVGLFLLWILWDRIPGRPGLTLLTYSVGTLAVVSAFMMVTRRSPVASALWFASAVVAAAVLMFGAGGQFVAVTTIVVYAGAVIVMFLFVIMLAQQRGLSSSDRESHEPALAALTFALLGGGILLAVGRYRPGAFGPDEAEPVVSKVAQIAGQGHVAGLGAVLFSEYAIAIEVVGTLLLVAMVAAVVIAARWRQVDEAD